MVVKAESVSIDSYSSKGIILNIGKIDSYSFYMDNEDEIIFSIIDEMPIKDLEAYILKRKAE